MKIIVEKYGGTSIGTIGRIKAVADHVIEKQRAGYGMVVVVSAMGDTTDKLLDMVKQLTPNPRSRELGMLLSTGELISCSLLAMAIQASGMRATSLTGAQGGIFTDDVYANARIVNIDTSRIIALLNQGEIIVLAGYQGKIGDEITVLGRGGSDATAVALACALDADHCHIFTDVRGVYTADPRVVPDAALLTGISYEEMIELAGSGARVMMGRAVEIARKYHLKVRVSSSYEQSNGTLITEVIGLEEVIITGIAANRDVALVDIYGIQAGSDTLSGILKVISEKQINIILLSSNRTTDDKAILSLVVIPEDVTIIESFLGEFIRSGKIEKYFVRTNVGLVSIVGSGIATHSGVAFEMFEALLTNGIDILMTSTSEIKIAVIVPQDLTDEAIRKLHDRFKLNHMQRNLKKMTKDPEA